MMTRGTVTLTPGNMDIGYRATGSMTLQTQSNISRRQVCPLIGPGELLIQQFCCPLGDRSSQPGASFSSLGRARLETRVISPLRDGHMTELGLRNRGGNLELWGLGSVIRELLYSVPIEDFANQIVSGF